MPQGELTVQVLGPVRVLGSDGEVVDLPSASQRRLLGALAVHAPAPVRTEWLCEVLGVTPGGLRTLVSRLRRLLGEGALLTTIGGYRLDAAIDSALACAEIRSAAGGTVALARALDRWVAPALEEFADESWATGEAARLATIHAAAVEDLAEGLIADRRIDDALAILEPHVVSHPVRDRPRGLVMRALAASGRQTEALRAYQDYRGSLVEAAGTEPTAELRSIEQRIATGWDGVDAEGAAVGGRPATPARTHAAMPEALAAAPTSVGRRPELAELHAVATDVLGRGVTSVLVSGEAGIGKTTLIASFVRESCASSGWHVFYGRCDEHVVVPFQPFPAVLGRMVDTLPNHVLVDHTATCGADLLRLVPQLRSRVASPLQATDDENTARHRLFEAIADIIRRTAATAPLVLVLDDLHWAEPAGLQLLTYLVRNLEEVPVLFVAGFRDIGDASGDHLRSALADLARSGALRIELDGLDTAELGELVHARIVATAGRDVGPVASRLHHQTAGNPLFAEHLLQHWAKEQGLALDDDVVSPSASIDGEVPTVLRDLVWHRVAALGPDAPPVLTAAAVFGLQFNQRVLAAMTDRTEPDVARILDRAVAAGVLADHPSISGTVRFAHALVARALEADLGSQTATVLHTQAFGAMLATRATPIVELAPQLARHAELGGLLDEAQAWSTTAGERALADLAPSEAARWFRKALDHATVLGRPAAERAELLVQLGEAATRAGHPTALDTIRQGAELAQRCGDDATLIRAALAIDRGSIRVGWFAEQLAIVEAAIARSDGADLATRARLTALLAVSLGGTDHGDRRRTVALEAVDLARSSLDPTLLARVASDVLWALWGPGTADLRSELAAEATAIADGSNDPHLTYVVHLVAYGTAVCAADADAAARYLGRLRDIVAEVGEPVMRWNLTILDGYNAVMEARFADAERIIAEALELGTQTGELDAFAIFAGQTYFLETFAGRHAGLLPIVEQMLATDSEVEPVFRIGHAIICCELDRPEVGTELLCDAMAAGLDAIADGWVRSTILIAYAVLAIELDDVGAAEWLAPVIEPMAGEVSFSGATSHGPISAYAGKLASILGRHDDAQRHLLDALVTAESFGWEYHRATTLIALAQNRVRASGELDDDAERWLSSAERLCTTHGIASWSKRADRLRAAVSV